MKTFITCIGLLLSLPAIGQNADTLRRGAKFENWKMLTSATTYYSSYIKKGSTITPLPGLWKRKVELDVANQEIIVAQSYTYTDTALDNQRLSKLKFSTLEPESNANLNNTARIMTTFSADKADLRLDSLKTGSNKQASITFSVKPFDFEADEELFALLPLKEHYRVSIPFYQPGTRMQPKYYTYEIVGIENIPIADGKFVECYKMQSEYTGGTSTWWISTKNHEIIRQQRMRKDGSIFCKVRVFGL